MLNFTEKQFSEIQKALSKKIEEDSKNRLWVDVTC